MVNPNLEKYKTLVDVFKGYLDTALTANIWFYAFTGAIVTYYLSNEQGKDYFVYSLLVPLILGLLVVWRSLVGIKQAYKLKREMFSEKTTQNPKELVFFTWKQFDTNCVPVDVLVGFLRASIFLVSLVCIGIIYIMLFSPLSIFTPSK